VSGVPGHTHNASAVASVLCNLERPRGFTHALTDAWADAAVAMHAAEIGDSDPVIDEADRFERAIERGVGEITLIPENCHQEIREPTRSIAEVRQLVAPQDKLRTVTYVEEVGGFVNPQTGAKHISDYPDILVDMLGQRDLNDADLEDPNQRYTSKEFLTPVSIRPDGGSRNANGTGNGYNFVVLQDQGPGNDSVGTLADGSDWNGIVPFRWVQAEKMYRSDPFTVVLRATVEVGPKSLTAAEAAVGEFPTVVGQTQAEWDALVAAAIANQAYPNELIGPLTVTFPSMETTTASNGYCLFIQEHLDATTVLLGATRENGEFYNPVIPLINVTKPGLQYISLYRWTGPPAYRFVVGGDAALPGPHAQVEIVPYFEALRNMSAANLALDMRAEFLEFLLVGAAGNGTGGTNWAAGNDNDIAVPAKKFHAYFSGFSLQDRREKYPVAGLPRNSHKGAVWYPLKNEFPTVAICQQVLAYDGVAPVNGTGQEVVREILDEAGAVSANTWRDSDIQVTMNQQSMTKTFDAGSIVPPGIASQGEDVVTDWLENDLDNADEGQQAAEEAQQQALIDAAQAAYDAQVAVIAQAQAGYDFGLAANALNLAALLATLQAAQAQGAALLAALQATQAELARIVQLRIPHFDEWYAPRYSYTGKVQFSISSAVNTDFFNPENLSAFGNAAYINQKMMMVRQRISFYKAGAVQGFHYDGAEAEVTHTNAISYTPFYHLLCDTTGTYGVTEPVIRASGTIKNLFELPSYIDMDDGSAVKDWHVVGISLPSDEREIYAYANPIFQNGAWGGVTQEQAAVDLAVLADYEGAAFDQTNYVNVVDGVDVINVQAVITALRNESQDIITATYEEFLTMGAGNALEVLMPLAGAVPGLRPQLIGHTTAGTDGATFIFQDLAFGFEEPRMFFMSLNNIGHKSHDHNQYHPSVYYFLSSDCVTEARQQTVAGVERTHVCTRVTKVYTWHGTILSAVNFHAQKNYAHGNMADSCCICQMGPEFQDLWFGEDGSTTVFDAIRAESRALGPVFRSQRRISQHLCAPILNPNARLQCSAPLNYETRHLPPELRDFVIRLGNVDWSFLPGTVTMEPLTLYEFNGGNQAPAAQDNLLHLPQFREGSTSELSDDGKFDFEVYSPYGMPSYIAVFARDTDFSINYKTQPLVTQLSIMCNTTMKKSNTILKADVHQLYHITQRNVHPRAEYDRFDFNKRQVILLRAEDIGLLGLHASEYQYEKRARFRFQGSVDQVGRVTALLIFNNRGLYVHGKQLSVERIVR